MKTKHIQIFDPALCCSTGVCGPDIDPELVKMAAQVEVLKKEGHQVDRFNLGQQPTEFANNDTVKSILSEEGVEALPLIFIDGEKVSSGSYPKSTEWSRWLAS